MCNGVTEKHKSRLTVANTGKTLGLDNATRLNSTLTSQHRQSHHKAAKKTAHLEAANPTE